MSFGLATCVHTLYTRYHMLYATHIKCTDAKTDFSRRCCGRVRLWRRRSALLVRCRIRNDMREISTNQRGPPLQPIFPPPPLMPEYDVMHSLEHGWGTGRVQETNVVLMQEQARAHDVETHNWAMGWSWNHWHASLT